MKNTNSTPQIIINGNAARFTGNTFINNLECNIRLKNMGKRELNNLYKSSESVRKAAKKKVQENYFDEVKNYLYNAIGDVVNQMKKKIESNEDKRDNSVDLDHLPEFKYDNISNIASLAGALQMLSVVIMSNARNINEKDIKKAFTENPCALFKEENRDGMHVSYKVEDNNIYKVIKEPA